MTTVFIFCTLVGAVLGMRFKVLILIPATIVAVIFVVIARAVLGDQISTIILAGITVATCLQVGYLGGGATRLVIAATRMPNRRAISDSLSRPTYRPVADA
jgi:hypothetical protein